jgi:hypothetical protein
MVTGSAGTSAFVLSAPVGATVSMVVDRVDGDVGDDVMAG